MPTGAKYVILAKYNTARGGRAGTDVRECKHSLPTSIQMRLKKIS